MGGIDIAIIAVIVLLVSFAVWRILKTRKKGCSCCQGSCGNDSCSCAKKKASEKKTRS